MTGAARQPLPDPQVIHGLRLEGVEWQSIAERFGRSERALRGLYLDWLHGSDFARRNPRGEVRR